MQNYNTTKTTQMRVKECDFLNVRKGPSTKYAVGFKIYTGRIIDVVSKQGSWARAKFNGSYGWCSLNYLEAVKHTIYINDTNIYTTTASINFRKAPDWNSSILYIAPKNIEVYVIDIIDGWAKVWYANTIMYAPASYLKDTGRIQTGSGSVDNSTPPIPPLIEEKEPQRPLIQYKNDFWIDIYSPEKPNFRFNTSELNMHMVEKPTEVINMMKYDKVDNLNADGDYTTTHRTYDVTDIDISFYVKRENYKHILKQLKQIVKMPSFRLTFGWNRRFFKYARISDNIEIEEFLYDDIEAKITITFELQPYNYAQGGIHYVKNNKTGDTFLKHGDVIVNNYEESYPKIFIPIPHQSLCPVDANGERVVTLAMYSDYTKETYNYRTLTDKN